METSLNQASFHECCWEEVVQRFRQVIVILVDVFQEIVRPLSEICTGFLAAPHHGVDDGRILGCIVIATEEIVLPADGYRTYAVLDEIIQTSG